MNEDYLLSRYLSAAELLPRHIKEKLYRLPKNEMLFAEEIRLRSSSGLSVLSAGREIFVESLRFTHDELADIVCAASGSSVHSASESIRSGFVTAENGHRIGICGTAAVREGKIIGIRAYSSLAIRISKEMPGIAEKTADRLMGSGGSIASVLIISPPGGGKTTFLRDLVRCASNRGIRTAVADERGEIAAMKNGAAQLGVGRCTDVLDLCPRGEAAVYLIRAMNPQLLAMDEITGERESEALMSAFGCGVALAATAHARSREELVRKEHYRKLMERGVFEYVAEIKTRCGCREYALSKWEAAE